MEATRARTSSNQKWYLGALVCLTIVFGGNRLSELHGRDDHSTPSRGRVSPVDLRQVDVPAARVDNGLSEAEEPILYEDPDVPHRADSDVDHQAGQSTDAAADHPFSSEEMPRLAPTSNPRTSVRETSKDFEAGTVAVPSPGVLTASSSARMSEQQSPEAPPSPLPIILKKAEEVPQPLSSRPQAQQHAKRNTSGARSPAREAASSRGAQSTGSGLGSRAGPHQSSPVSPHTQPLESTRRFRKLCDELAPSILSELDPGHGYVPLRESDDVLAALCQSQYPSAGTARPAVVFVDDEESAGLGARMMRMNCALYSAWSNGATLLTNPHGHWLYTSTRDCPEKNHHCYFQQLASGDRVAEVTEHSLKNREEEDKEGMHKVGLTGTHWRSGLHFPRHLIEKEALKAPLTQWARGSLNAFYEQGRGLEQIKNLVPKSSQRSGCLLFGQLMFFLMQPNAQVEALARAARERLHFKHPIIAMHVRHGDRAARGQAGALHGLDR
ncbi:hypothetical protein CYMTET_40468 [Cymbomonas tetramitiformis]|uniref:Uncharacterized protein n=1 Tax=Cymbomonas tetramitiformis TaxID=36881 RepID=A0AAE0C805_9CHLO|nr:hypothetical protein CYMTET_40468 [Cymbomonas tetramitiformis]